MDIFRSITITLAIILLVFMAMIMYYEFKTKLSNASWPPYSRRCPDYSYDDVSIHTEINQTGPLCKFNDQFDYNTFINTKHNDVPIGHSLCNNGNNPNAPLLWCKADGENVYSGCKKLDDTSSQTGNVDMIFAGDGLDDIERCGLTKDGYV